MNKQFITLKVGYSRGIYGCSDEYFTTIIINGDDIKSISYSGLYGSEERINAILKDSGYKQKHVPSDYGLIKTREAWKGFEREEDAIKNLKELLQNNNL